MTPEAELSITFDGLVLDVGAVMDGLGLERAAIAAESAGCAVALKFALRHPERVEALILVSPAIGPAYPDDHPFRLALQRNHDATLDAFTTACLPEPASESIWHWGRHGILARATPEATLALLGARPAPGFLDRARAIACPTLVIAGERDAIAPPDEARALAGAVPRARFMLLDGAGHVPTLTRPDEIAAAMEAFLG